jgi:hypothetical protein
VKGEIVERRGERKSIEEEKHGVVNTPHTRVYGSN